MHKHKFTRIAGPLRQDPHRCDFNTSAKTKKAFTLFELLVAIAIVAATLAIMMPALRKSRQNAWALRCMDNQREIVIAAISYAVDNKGRYPESVATIGTSDEHWNWQEPTMVTSYRSRTLRRERSMSQYLRSYVPDPGSMFCPNAPKKYKYWYQAWEAGDDWDNPQTPPSRDPVSGTYCFYWNYIGFLEEQDRPFVGPQTMTGEGAQSKLLVSDYFGYGHWRNKFTHGDTNAYGSSEKLKWPSVTPGTWVSSAFWSRWAGAGDVSLDTLDADLHAGYTDGHVERYAPVDVVTMKVSKTPDGTVPYPSEPGPGDFYIPKNALN